MCAKREQKRESIVSSTEEFASLLRILTSNNNNEKQSRKRVRFSSEISCSTPTNLNREEVRSLWHDVQTISTFKTNARKIILHRITNQNNNSNDNDDDDDTTCTRGFESCTYERQLQRHQTIECIVSSYNKGITSDRLAEIASQCTSWNRSVAILQACHDYFEVHQPELPLPEIENTPPAFPFPMKKRTSSDMRCSSIHQSQQQRRVRRRTIL